MKPTSTQTRRREPTSETRSPDKTELTTTADRAAACRRGSADEASEDDATDGATGRRGDADGRGRPRLQALEREGDVAADYLEELLDIADLDGDLDMDVDGDRAAVSIVGADLSQLVGERGEVLDALQELTRLAVYRETGERSRLMLDVSGYRADQRARLVALAQESVAQVQGDRRARRAGPDVAVRAQGRPRRGGRGRPDVGVRGRRAPALRGDPARA